MATIAFNDVFDHTSDAGFRAWCTELKSLLETGGALVQTSDTGQINLSTVTRPSTNTNGGYLVFAFSDSAQATAPYVFRFDLGTSSPATAPRVRLTVGTGSNGAGAITGALVTDLELHTGYTPASTSVPYRSFACGHPGSLALAFKCGSNGNTSGMFVLGLHRIRAADGSQSNDGLLFLCNDTGTGVNVQQRTFRRVSPASFGPSSAFCLVPMLPTSSSIPGGEPTFYRHSTGIPEPRPVLEWGTVISAELSFQATTTARPIGPADRTYIGLGTFFRAPAAGATGGSTTYSLCMWYD